MEKIITKVLEKTGVTYAALINGLRFDEVVTARHMIINIYVEQSHPPRIDPKKELMTRLGLSKSAIEYAVNNFHNKQKQDKSGQIKDWVYEIKNEIEKGV